MSLKKAIESGKERRKPYKGSKSWDSSCRNHGSCSWCERSRTHNTKKKLSAAKQQIEETVDQRFDRLLKNLLQEKAQLFKNLSDR